MGEAAVVVHGTVEPGFEHVADAFTADVSDHGDVGSLGHVTNQMQLDLTGDARSTSLVGSVVAALDEQG